MFLKFKYYLFFLLITVNLEATDLELQDTITVHDMTLYGKVINLNTQKISFQLQYSQGISYISYKDIDTIKTEHTYHISFENRDIEGKIVGIEENQYLKVMTSTAIIKVKISNIDNFVISLSNDDSLENYFYNKIPYLQGNANLGLELEEGISKKKKIDLTLNLKHKKTKYEVTFFLDYAFETTKIENSKKRQNKDELLAILTYKNHLDNNRFYYASFAGDYDRPRHISNRYIPHIGYGEKIKIDKSKWIEPSIGIGYATTKYQEENFNNKYFSVIALALSGEYRFNDMLLINRLITNASINYFPSIKEFNKDWILRSNLTFTAPVFNFFSIKLSFDLINDSNPDPTVGNNKITSKLLFGFDF